MFESIVKQVWQSQKLEVAGQMRWCMGASTSGHIGCCWQVASLVEVKGQPPAVPSIQQIGIVVSNDRGVRVGIMTMTARN